MCLRPLSAIAVDTKDGFTSPGTRAEVTAGSFGRVTAQAETGGSTGDLGYFVTAAHFDEDGWRDFSPSEATQLFGTLGIEAGDARVDVSLTYADTDLIGNGAVPVDLLETTGSPAYEPRGLFRDALPRLARRERVEGSFEAAASPPSIPTPAFRPGARVRHPLFGVGTVLRSEGSGDDLKLTVSFPAVGAKRLVARFAGLVAV